MLIVSGIIPTKIFEYVTLFLVKNTNPTNNKINNTSNKSSLLFFLITTSFNNMTNNINEYTDIRMLNVNLFSNNLFKLIKIN